MIKLKSILLSEQGKRKTGYNAFTQADGNKQGDDPFEERNYPPKLKGLGAVKKGDFSITSAADPANKGKKNIISETIKRAIAILIPNLTLEVWCPPLEDSTVISNHQDPAVQIKKKNAIFKTEITLLIE